MMLPLFVLVILTIVLVMAYQNTKKNDKVTKGFLIISYLIILGICFKYGIIQNKSLLEGFEVEIPDTDEVNDDNKDVAVEDELENILDDMDEDEDNNNDDEDNNDKDDEDNNDNEDEDTKETKITKQPYKGATMNDLKNLENKSSSLNNLKSQINNNKNNNNTKITKSITPTKYTTSNIKKSTTKEGFNSIVQKDTSGTSSVFKPQIIINATDGTLSSDLDNTESMSNIPFNKNQRIKFLSSKRANDLFANNSILNENDESLVYNVNQEQETDAFTWLKKNKKRQQTDNNSSRGTEYTQYNGLDDSTFSNNESFYNTPTTTTVPTTTQASSVAQCGTFKPYAVETGTDLVYIDYDKQTLTNKSFVPGLQYMPPTTWHVPQPHKHTQCRNVCSGGMIDTRNLPIAIMDHGTPVNALEIGYDGTIAKTEEEVRLTNVGSILPKFEFKEYIDCYENPYARPRNSQVQQTTTTTTSKPTDNISGSMLN